jgi:hypothetical protein
MAHNNSSVRSTRRELKVRISEFFTKMEQKNKLNHGVALSYDQKAVRRHWEARFIEAGFGESIELCFYAFDNWAKARIVEKVNAQ